MQMVQCNCQLIVVGGFFEGHLKQLRDEVVSRLSTFRDSNLPKSQLTSKGQFVMKGIGRCWKKKLERVWGHFPGK